MTDWRNKSRRLDLRQYVTDIFVETGTWRCGGVKHALSLGFQKVITIEGSKKIWERAPGLVASSLRPRVEFVFGNSEDMLPGVIAELPPDKRVTYWLDAHIHGGYQSSVGGSSVMRELDAILASGRKQDIILIDDVRMFSIWRPKIDYDEVVAKLSQINESYVISRDKGHIVDDVLVAQPGI